MDRPSAPKAVLAVYACPTCKQVFRIRNARSGARYKCKDCCVELQAAVGLQGIQPTAIKPAPHIPTAQARPAASGDLELQIADAPKASGNGLIRLVPEFFDGYRVLQVLGRGGMGVVMLVEQTHLQRKAAIKLMLPNAIHLDPHATERFMREARTVANLRHPHIVEIYEVGAVKGMPYLSMEYIEGRSLTKFLETDRLGPQQQAEIIGKIALALAYAHKQGFIHRDIKPDNIMVRHNGEPVLMDFGLAKETGPERVKLSMTGSVLGTPAYMSPEQAQGIKVDERSDVYGLGAVLYEALTRRAPFGGATAVATIYQVVHEQARSVREINPAVDRALEAICVKSMEKDPQRRYASMDELAQDLLRYQDGRAVQAAAPALARRVSEWLVARKALCAGLAGVASVLLLVLLAFQGGWLKRGPSEAARLREALALGSTEACVARIKVLASDLREGRIKVGSTEATDVLTVLREATDNQDPEGQVSSTAIDALADLKDEGAADALRRQLTYTRPVPVRKAALVAYARLAPLDRGPVLFAALQNDPALDVRLVALEVIGNVVDPLVLLYLMKLSTRGEPPALAAAARHKLSNLRTSDALHAQYLGGGAGEAGRVLGHTLIQTNAYNNQLDEALTEARPTGVQKNRTHETFEVAAEKLLKGSPEERLLAAFDLGVLADARSEVPLGNALRDADADVALTAADALGKLPGIFMPTRLVELLRVPSPSTRRAAARALSMAKPPYDGAPVAEALSMEKDALVQAEMARALGRLKTKLAVPALLAVLADGAGLAKRNAAWALGQLGDSSAVCVLVEALDRARDDQELKAEVAGALSALTGKSLGLDAAKWRAVLKP